MIRQANVFTRPWPSRLDFSHLHLVEVSHEHLQFIADVHSDFETRRYIVADDQRSLMDLKCWFEADYYMVPTFIMYIIVTDVPVGYCSVGFIGADKIEVGIVVHRDYRRQKVATRAVQDVCKFAFGRSVHKVVARIMTGNVASVHMFEGLGFQIEGVLRKELQDKGVYKDLIQMSLLKEEFHENLDVAKLQTADSV